MTPDTRALHRRTVASLVGSQIVGGIGTSSGIAVAALAAESLGGAELSGLGQTAAVLGSALAAVPLARLMSVRGRRPGLAAGYLVAATGAVVCHRRRATRIVLALPRRHAPRRYGERGKPSGPIRGHGSGE
ncbi:MAG TPA: hypothetical protein VII16_18065 [Actinomycetes bacterium]|jgi:MFS family permease